MGEGRITTKEIASMAGVSIATVSHVINRTRYVSPELEERVMAIIKETGYIEKVENRERKLKIGRGSVIVGVFPNIVSAVYRNMAMVLKKQVSARGYQFMIVITDDNLAEEQQLLESLIVNKKVAGILHVPVSDEAGNYRKLIMSNVPFVCMERNILGEQIDSVTFQDRKALFEGTTYLIGSGHKNLLFLREKAETTTKEERTRGFLDALREHHMNAGDANMVDVDLGKTEEECQNIIQRALRRVMPTAVIAGGNRLTTQLMKTIRNMGLKCPEELSVIGFGDEMWTELIDPPLTTLERDVEGLGNLAAAMLFEKISMGRVITRERCGEVSLHVRKSTRMLENGPCGEKAVSPSEITLSQEEKRRLRTRRYRVAISFHYTGTAWAELHEKGIRDELERYGIDVISVMDAHFDPELQNMQLQGILVQKPDAVIAVPADDKKTADRFRELASVSKLVFISNLPEEIGRNSYVSCVSVNEAENGTSAGRMLGEYFRGKEQGKVGFLNHGAIFYGTRERDAAAEKALDSFPNVEIVTSRGFGQIGNAYQVCRDMVEAHPEIQALYVSWDQPALGAIRALKELGREDIAVFTTDLGPEIARCMEEGIVKGISTQRFYEQGRAAALAAAKSLVDESVPKYVGVQPYAIEPGQLRRAWKEIFHESMPESFPQA
ncbi:MAG: LacI family DNA-binding transcriptional regulator [Eubacteriales bacterium]|nr:LacI family DNA-binding transcriptional regulator [Eubacteriales bacterium]